VVLYTLKLFLGYEKNKRKIRSNTKGKNGYIYPGKTEKGKGKDLLPTVWL